VCENENFEGFGSLQRNEWRGNVRKFVGKWEMGGGGELGNCRKMEIFKILEGFESLEENEWRGNVRKFVGKCE
jgi:transcriptional regulator of aromatic amino acid metabolism